MPDVQEFPDDPGSLGSTAEDDQQVDTVELLLAGFRACAKEAIRFLLEEEGLSPDHSLPVGLQEHLDRQESHLTGMLHTDSGLDNDGYYSTDDASFVSSDCGYSTDVSKMLESSGLSSVSVSCTESSSVSMSCTESACVSMSCTESASVSMSCAESASVSMSCTESASVTMSGTESSSTSQVGTGEEDEFRDSNG